MNIGTRSVLYGAHCAILHPWFLALAWWKLYGFPWDVRLWAAFGLHDVGYISKRDMDGAVTGAHVEPASQNRWRCFWRVVGEPSTARRIRGIGRSGTDCKSPVFAWPTNWPSC